MAAHTVCGGMQCLEERQWLEDSNVWKNTMCRSTQCVEEWVSRQNAICGRMLRLEECSVAKLETCGSTQCGGECNFWKHAMAGGLQRLVESCVLKHAASRRRGMHFVCARIAWRNAMSRRTSMAGRLRRLEEHNGLKDATTG